MAEPARLWGDHGTFSWVRPRFGVAGLHPGCYPHKDERRRRLPSGAYGAAGGTVTGRLEAFRKVLDRARGTRGLALMGVCNVTPDSFSDGGQFFAPEAAHARVDALIIEGADIVDVGGESTRPGAAPVAIGEQLARVLGVVRHAVARGACVSVDTAEPAVAAACLGAGACVVNDVSCLRDGALAAVVAAHGAALILMHSRARPAQMHGFSVYPDAAYGDVVVDVCAEWEGAAERARLAGVGREALVMDPGLGFAKNALQSLQLIARLSEIVGSVGVDVAVGASRKSFLTAVDRGASPSQREGASLAAALHAARAGASVLRVHDVRASRQAIDFTRRMGAG